MTARCPKCQQTVEPIELGKPPARPAWFCDPCRTVLLEEHLAPTAPAPDFPRSSSDRHDLEDAS